MAASPCAGRQSSMRWRIGLGGLAFVTGLIAVDVVERGGAATFAGASTRTELLLLGAGWSLAAGAATFGLGRPRHDAVSVLMLAASAWFAAEWYSPEAESAVVFTAGLALWGAAPPFVAWALVGFLSGQLRSWWHRILVSSAILSGVVVVGLLPALFLDPVAIGCAACPRNLLLLDSRPDLAFDLSGLGLRLGGLLLVTVVVVTGWRVLTVGHLRRSTSAPFLACAATYVVGAALAWLRGAERGFVGTGSDQRWLWQLQAVALVGAGVGLAWAAAETRRARLQVADVVLRQGEASRMSSLDSPLADLLGDPSLRIVYPVGNGNHVDAAGNPLDVAELTRATDRSVTRVVRGGELVASLVHRRGPTAEPGIVDQVLRIARLGLEHEALSARLRARERELRASRQRVVATADRERRQLERDLHDGAQQRVVGLLLGLELVRASAPDASNAADGVDAVVRDLRRAADGLREVAHGIHPAVLSDEGLAGALEVLAENRPGAVFLEQVTGERFTPEVESAAYVVVVAVADGHVRVRATHEDGRLVLDLATTDMPERLVEVEDRVGAMDGSVEVTQTPDGVRLRAAIPCA